MGQVQNACLKAKEMSPAREAAKGALGACWNEGRETTGCTVLAFLKVSLMCCFELGMTRW